MEKQGVGEYWVFPAIYFNVNERWNALAVLKSIIAFKFTHSPIITYLGASDFTAYMYPTLNINNISVHSVYSGAIHIRVKGRAGKTTFRTSCISQLTIFDTQAIQLFCTFEPRCYFISSSEPPLSRWWYHEKQINMIGIMQNFIWQCWASYTFWVRC